MDFGWDQKLNSDRVDAYERDGDAARLGGWWHEPAGPARRSAVRVGNTVRRALGAIACCRWDDVQDAIEELERIELRPVAQLAARTVRAPALGDEQKADELIERLGRTQVAAGADPHVWACGVIAAALHGYLTGGVSETAQPVSLVRQMCARFGQLHPEAAHLMCLSLARLELEEGNAHAASRWVERTRRFGERYGARLPMQVIGRVRDQVPG